MPIALRAPTNPNSVPKSTPGGAPSDNNPSVCSGSATNLPSKSCAEPPQCLDFSDSTIAGASKRDCSGCVVLVPVHSPRSSQTISPTHLPPEILRWRTMQNHLRFGHLDQPGTDFMARSLGSPPKARHDEGHQTKLLHCLSRTDHPGWGWISFTNSSTTRG